jgi:hypothetical protein
VCLHHDIEGKVKKNFKNLSSAFKYVHWTVGLVEGFEEVSMNLAPLSLAEEA